MKRFAAVILFTLAAAPAHAQDYSALMMQMAACTENEQCMVVEDICGKWAATNKRVESDYLDFIAKVRPAASCPVLEAMPKPAAAHCVNNFCVVKE